MRYWRTATATLLAAIAIAGCGSAQTDKPVGPDIEATVDAAVARELTAQRVTNNPDEVAITEETSDTPEPYRPYADLNLPTPTVPAWMERLNAGGPPPMTKPRDGERTTNPHLAALVKLQVRERRSETGYERSDWGGWTDHDRDCQDTRAEVLIQESTQPVTYRRPDECVVDTGEWKDPWTGQRFTAAADLDVDHHVPLAHAHEAGGENWTSDQKAAFANDMTLPDALNATLATVNRQKAAQPPDKWRPPDRSSWCRYAVAWIEIKTKWQLNVSPAEVGALTEMLDTCAP